MKEVIRQKNRCSKADLIGQLKKKNMFNFNIDEAINSLCDSGYICEEDEYISLLGN